MSTQEPNRLVDSDSESETLRVDLARANAAVVDYDVAAGVAAFEVAVANVPAGSGGSDMATAAGASGGAKTAVVAVAVAVAVAAAVAVVGLAGGDDDERRAAAPVPAEVSTIEPQNRDTPAPDPALDASALTGDAKSTTRSDVEDLNGDTAEDEPEGATGSSEPQPKVRPPKRKPKPTQADRLRAEMQATDRAGKALASDPARALSLARKADREFAGGLFAEQRAGVKTLALFALGKTSQARQAAERYLRKHPKGTYADKIRTKLNEKP